MSERAQSSENSWIFAIVALAGLKGIRITEAEMQKQIVWSGDEEDVDQALQRVAHLSGLQLDIAEIPLDDVPEMILPAAFELQTGEVVLVIERSLQTVSVIMPTAAGLNRSEMDLDAFRASLSGKAGFIEPLSSKARNARLEAFLSKTTGSSWFWETVLADRRGYGQIMLASFFGNMLTFGTSLFAMQVWDRVVPAQSIPTLWVLALGVVMALFLELTLRTARVSVLDRLGRQADVRISSQVFARAMDIRNDARPKSTGSFIAQIRDIEQVRELLTSATIGALIDLPFIILFLGLFALLAGPLTYVLVAALVLIALPGILLQVPLSRFAQQGMKESALRNAILVESIERIEEIKASQAESRFQALWERFVHTGSKIGASQRFFSTLFVNWTQTLQQLAYTAVIVAGAYMVMDGDMSMGALIACSILTNRALVLFMPLGQVFTRWQSAKVAIRALDDLMGKPVDHDPEAGLLRRSTLRGNYAIDGLTYAYDEDAPVVLKVDRLVIRQGERVALLGRIGAGKSTLLRLLAGMARPNSGKLLLDGTSLSQISPVDVRRETGYLGQSAQLFLGTIRENLLVGSPIASDDEILKALMVTGGLPLIQNQPYGLDLLLREGGAGLSGGQRQTLLLARTLLRNGSILLLDEPSAPLDEISERQLVRSLGQWLGDKTLVVTTNRPGLLDLVDRIVVIEGGRVALDGPKDKVLEALANPEIIARKMKSGGKVAKAHEGVNA